MVIDLSPIVQSIVGIAATAIGVLGTAVLYKLQRKYSLQISTSQEASFDAALKKSITYGATEAVGIARTKGWDHPDVHNVILGAAIQHLVSAFPAALKAVGLSPQMGDPKNIVTITAALQRALPGVVATVSKSPAIPPVVRASTTPAGVIT